MQWLTNGVNFLRTFRTNIIIGAILAVALAGSYVGVYQIGRARGTTAEVRQEVRTQVQYRDRQTTEYRQVSVRNVHREQSLERLVTQLQTSNRTLHEQLQAVPDPHPAEYLSVGDVCLLNQASRLPTDTHPPDPACGIANAFTTDSTVSHRAFESAEIDLRFQYTDLAVRHDALVEFVNTELIGPPH